MQTEDRQSSSTFQLDIPQDPCWTGPATCLQICFVQVLKLVGLLNTKRRRQHQISHHSSCSIHCRTVFVFSCFKIGPEMSWMLCRIERGNSFAGFARPYKLQHDDVTWGHVPLKILGASTPWWCRWLFGHQQGPLQGPETLKALHLSSQSPSSS